LPGNTGKQSLSNARLDVYFCKGKNKFNSKLTIVSLSDFISGCRGKKAAPAVAGAG
jgi:hypothetical protein